MLDTQSVLLRRSTGFCNNFKATILFKMHNDIYSKGVTDNTKKYNKVRVAYVIYRNIEYNYTKSVSRFSIKQ